MDTRRLVPLFSDTTLIAAGAAVVSGWFDLGKACPRFTILRSFTQGTYAFEVEYSRDGGSTQFGSTDTITTSAALESVVPKARWARFRVRNTHGSLPFTAHSTVVQKDGATGR